MRISFKGYFSPYVLCKLAIWIKEHLTDITILELNKTIRSCDCKITKIGNRKILVEGETTKMFFKKNLSNAIGGNN